MKNYTNEQLVTLAADGNEDALEQLFRNLKPIILHEAEMYRGKMVTYSTEDLIQEANIVAWEIIAKGNFKTGKFSSYYSSALKKRFTNIYRDYTLKNLICIGEHEDCRGNVTKVMVESNYAKAYREKHRAECKAWYERKKAAQPPKAPKPKQTREEKAAKQKAYQQEYYAAHPEKYQERLAKQRAYQKRKYEEKKAARMAATA